MDFSWPFFIIPEVSFFLVTFHLLLSITVDFYLMTKSPSSIIPSLKYFSTGCPAWSQRCFCPVLPSGPCFFPVVPHPLRETYSCQSLVTMTGCAQSSVDPQDPYPTLKPCPCRINENATWALMSYTFTPQSYSSHAQGLPVSIIGVHMDDHHGIIVWGLDMLQQSPWNTSDLSPQQTANISG